MNKDDVTTCTTPRFIIEDNYPEWTTRRIKQIAFGSWAITMILLYFFELITDPEFTDSSWFICSFLIGYGMCVTVLANGLQWRKKFNEPRVSI